MGFNKRARGLVMRALDFYACAFVGGRARTACKLYPREDRKGREDSTGNQNRLCVYCALSRLKCDVSGQSSWGPGGTSSLSPCHVRSLHAFRVRVLHCSKLARPGTRSRARIQAWTLASDDALPPWLPGEYRPDPSSNSRLTEHWRPSGVYRHTGPLAWPYSDLYTKKHFHRLDTLRTLC